MGEGVKYSKKKVVKAYAVVAWFYDVWSFLTESRAMREALEFSDLEDGEDVLEVAVGTGRFFEKVVCKNPHGVNEGLDISPSMLKIARKRLRKYRNVRLVKGDAYKLPFRKGTFDVVFNNFMLDLLPEEGQAKVLEEFKKVLKPRGRVVVATMTFGRSWFSKVWDVIARKAPFLLTGCRPVDMEQMIEDAGFVVEKTLYVSQNTFPSLVISARKK